MAMCWLSLDERRIAGHFVPQHAKFTQLGNAVFMFDTARFLQDHFGDSDGVVGLVGKHSDKIPAKEAVRKWFSRGAIPGDWLPVLLVALERENGAYPKLAAYLTGDDCHDIFA